MAQNGWPTSAEYMAHASRHQNGGTDEIDCTGLQGAGGAGGTGPGQLAARHFVSITKTNIGTAYTDIYVAAAFAERNLNQIDWANVTDVRIVWIWDRGAADTGTQQCRWVDQADNTKVLYESPTFTADQDPANSGWFTKPAAFTGIQTVEWQGKSTVAGDDPIPKGFAIYVR